MSASLPAITLANVDASVGASSRSVRRPVGKVGLFRRTKRTDVSPYEVGFTLGFVAATRLRAVAASVKRLVALDRLERRLASSDPATRQLAADLSEVVFYAQAAETLIDKLDGLAKSELGSAASGSDWPTADRDARSVFDLLAKLGVFVARLLSKTSLRNDLTRSVSLDAPDEITSEVVDEVVDEVVRALTDFRDAEERANLSIGWVGDVRSA